MNILFVCTGNTCRSPMAAGLMNKIAREKGLNAVAESAGIFAREGEPASHEAIVVMGEYGVDLTEHRAQMIREELIEKSDLILTMTPAHKMLLGQIAADKVFTLGEYAGLDLDIQDPFGGSVNNYRETAAQIQQALVLIAERILRER